MAGAYRITCLCLYFIDKFFGLLNVAIAFHFFSEQSKCGYWLFSAQRLHFIEWFAPIAARGAERKPLY
jgi:hypothetical protein